MAGHENSGDVAYCYHFQLKHTYFLHRQVYSTAQLHGLRNQRQRVRSERAQCLVEVQHFIIQLATVVEEHTTGGGRGRRRVRRLHVAMLVGFFGLLGGCCGDDCTDGSSWQAATPRGIQSLASQHLRRRDFPLTPRVRVGGLMNDVQRSRAPRKLTLTTPSLAPMPMLPSSAILTIRKHCLQRQNRPSSIKTTDLSSRVLLNINQSNLP